MRSSWLLGVVFIVLGGLSLTPLGGHRVLTPAQWGLAIFLVAAGAFTFTRLRASYYVALVAATLTVVTGILGLAHHPEYALPIHPAASIGFGLYLIFRTAIASPQFGGAPKKKGFLP